MKLIIIAAFTLAAGSSLHAQTPAASTADLSTAAPISGTWSYSARESAEAAFLNASAQTQIVIRCARATRRITISKPAAGAAPFLFIWTSSLTRNLPASYNPATARISADLSAYDPLLDAIAFSRGRIGFGVSGQSTLVVPAWPETARTIEECRA